ncbi:hypothetical protein AO354_08725 [Pseudomonas syringae pv. syringae]|nr:hypothetical protein AO354_08725 [Pseudomonas syringae pv. syringae]
MKNRFKLCIGTTALILSASALAKPVLHTATIDQHGNIVAQSSPWIKSVSYSSQKDYFATYKVHAKLGGAATTEQVNVLGLMVGKRGASGDSSMSFQLACSN